MTNSNQRDGSAGVLELDQLLCVLGIGSAGSAIQGGRFLKRKEPRMPSW